MPERPVGVTDETAGSGVVEYRTRERDVDGVTVAEQYLIPTKERVPSAMCMAATFRTAADATQVGSLYNEVGSGVIVALLGLMLMKDQNASSANSTGVIVWRCTSAPSGGAVLSKVEVDTALPGSSAGVTARSAATADGVGAGMTNGTAGTRLMRFGASVMLRSTVAGQIDPRIYEFPVEATQGRIASLLGSEDMDPICILREGEGIQTTIDTPTSLGWYIMSLLWEEYALP